MIEELKRFVLVAKEGNITKAAEKIFITQSALTQSLQRLEKSLGTKLFVQKGKYLSLTDEGRAAETIATKILQLWNNAQKINSGTYSEKRMSIGMFDNAALRLSSFFQKYHATQEIDLTIDGSPKLLKQLTLGVLDVAICVLRSGLYPKNILHIASFNEILIPVSSKKFSGPLHTIPFILYNKDSYTRKQTDEVFAKKHIAPTIYAESTSTTFMKELALRGNGIALLPTNVVISELEQKHLFKQKIPLTWKRTFGVFINTEGVVTKDHPLIKELLQELKRIK